MPAPVQVRLRLKNGAEVSRLLSRASAITGKLPEAIVKRFVFSMAIRARKTMPVVDRNKIRQELEQIQTRSVTTPSGKAVSKQAPLIALIIQSRIKKQGYWKLNQSPFKGVSRRKGIQAMKKLVRRVSGARRGSAGYFRLQATAIMDRFGRNSGRLSRIADGQLVTGLRALARFWMNATRPDTHEGNMALFRFAEPVWQRALDAEAESLRNYTAKKEYSQALKAIGLKVV